MLRLAAFPANRAVPFTQSTSMLLKAQSCITSFPAYDQWATAAGVRVVSQPKEINLILP